ncbi:hypothetical protein [Candidatus Protofrankia californiensis]|uniref:hypothetical protein n=1 Tax=Candidatus Protofrankia californiensis TaxID=1839754 RepID=UPI0019D2C2F4|nr:hypothetical protein [Candidatus Protofrankia californiensis]
MAGPGRMFWLASGAGMSVLVLAALTAGFDYRYLGSVVGLLGAAAVLGWTALARTLGRFPRILVDTGGDPGGIPPGGGGTGSGAGAGSGAVDDENAVRSSSRSRSV